MEPLCAPRQRERLARRQAGRLFSAAPGGGGDGAAQGGRRGVSPTTTAQRRQARERSPRPAGCEVRGSHRQRPPSQSRIAIRLARAPHDTHVSAVSVSQPDDKCVSWGGGGGGRALRAPPRTRENPAIGGEFGAVARGARRFSRVSKARSKARRPPPPSLCKGLLSAAETNLFPPKERPGERGLCAVGKA